ncbi:MAG: multicopper oxidase domain-containing protein [Bacteroidota bacterium]
MRQLLKWTSVLSVMLLWGTLQYSQAQTPEYEIDGMTFGMPEAQVTDDDYDGPPVVGEYLTQLPNLKPLDYEGNKHHEVRIDVMVQEIEVAPGVSYRAWTFGGAVPGPVLHVREGDRITFVMKNRSNEEVSLTEPGLEGSPFLDQVRDNDYQKNAPAMMPMPHSMDFHSGTVAKDDKWRSIAPGQTITFDWVANYAGTYIYHCGTPSVLMHTAMGQHGVVVVSPKEGFPTDEQVDHEYVVVQSEYYLKKGTGDLYQYDNEAARNRNPSHVVFNGHLNALHDAPLEAKAGERVRLHVSNNGPSGTSSFHVIGAIFDRVFYEGHPFNEWRGMQTVLLGASNSAAVEFIVPEAGKYVLVDHEFADAERGATGTLVAKPGN